MDSHYVAGKDGEIIMLSIGRRVQWVQPDAFQKYTLCTIDYDEEGFECGNPRNLLQLCPEAERKLVRDKEPQACGPPLHVKSIMYHRVFDSEAEVKSELISMTCCSCWGIYITSVDRKVVHKIYFDTRSIDRDDDDFRDSPDYKEEDKKRQAIIDDPIELLHDMESGLTVVVVLGQTELAEVYYFKIGQLYLRVKVDH